MNEIRILVQFAAEDLATADQHVAQLHNTCNRVANTPVVCISKSFGARSNPGAMP